MEASKPLSSWAPSSTISKLAPTSLCVVGSITTEATGQALLIRSARFGVSPTICGTFSSEETLITTWPVATPTRTFRRQSGEEGYLAGHRQCRMHGPERIVFMGPGVSEQADRAIAELCRQHAAKAFGDRGAAGKKGMQNIIEFLGVHQG